MPLAIFRITKVAGTISSLAEDPFIQVNYFSAGKVGTPQYRNEAIHVLAAPRRSGYPGMRWLLLVTSQLQISAILHTEHYDLLLENGQLTDFKTFGPAGMHIFTVSINVHTAGSVTGGAMWFALQQSQVTREPDEEGITDDLLALRGRKLAGRVAGWVWDKF